MATRSKKVLPPFDFSQAIDLPLSERFELSLQVARELIEASDYQAFSDFPCLPKGASEAEVSELEELLGSPLPREYRLFLKMSRYLKIDDGIEVGGLDHEGISVTESPWISDQHREGVEYLVFANYWCYADGDQLMFDLSEPDCPVVAYLHEHGPLFEDYAPSFSLALWRLMHEAQKNDGK